MSTISPSHYLVCVTVPRRIWRLFHIAYSQFQRYRISNAAMRPKYAVEYNRWFLHGTATCGFLSHENMYFGREAIYQNTIYRNTPHKTLIPTLTLGISELISRISALNISTLGCSLSVKNLYVIIVLVSVSTPISYATKNRWLGWRDYSQIVPIILYNQ